VRRLPLIVLAALIATAAAAALFARAGAAGEVTSFRTPHASAACKLEAPRRLVCSSLGSTGSAAIRSEGAPTVVQRLPWWDASTPVLHSWRHGRLACTLRGQAMLCRNGAVRIRIDGAGFSVGS
jgi:hypothetical protein